MTNPVDENAGKVLATMTRLAAALEASTAEQRALRKDIAALVLTLRAASGKLGLGAVVGRLLSR